MPLFKRPVYHTNSKTAPIEIPKDIPKPNELPKDIPKQNILVPSFIVSLSQHIISFLLRKSSHLPFIGTKDGGIRMFEVDEFHILMVSLLALSIHYTRKYRKQCKQCSLHLNKLLIASKMHNFETLAAVDHNNIKRIECFYYKNQFQMYDIDLLTRTELRTFIQQIMSQCEVLSGLSLKILETVNTMFKIQRKKELQSIYEEKLRKNSNLRSNSQQQRLKVEKRNREQQIDEYYDGEEERLDKYQSFFDEKNNEQYLHEMREQQMEITEKEILDSYNIQKEHKQIEINAVKLSSVNDDEKMTEEQDKNMIDPLHKKRKLLELEMNCDHEYLVKQTENVPIQQIDFSNKDISRYNLQKEVNQMKYDIILNEEGERRTEKLRKYGVITVIVATTVFTYWYNRHYEGKAVLQRIRDTKARVFPYF